MSTITFHGDTINTNGTLPNVGDNLQDFTLVAGDLSEKDLSDFKGKNVILNIFPSVNTGVCATSVRKFNEAASKLNNTVVLCISKDLPFAQSQFCAAEGIENVVMLSDFRSKVGENYGVEMIDGPLKGLLSRSIIVVDPEGKVIYTEQVAEVTEEPNYDAALEAL
jgi:thiol peroxidase